jgi:replicative DNA helicase
MKSVNEYRQSGVRLLPHSIEAEESVLGAMLLSRDSLTDCLPVLCGTDFYRPAHGHIFDAISAVSKRAEPVDVITVSEQLRRDGLIDLIGGSSALVSLQAGCPTMSNGVRYAEIVKEHSRLRQLVTVGNEISEIGYSEPHDVTEAIDRAETLMFNVTNQQAGTATTMHRVRDLLDEQLDVLEAKYDRKETVTGLPTGYIDLDEQLNGLHPNGLYIIGARPAMGKSAFALGIAAHAAIHQKRPVLFCSLEMGHLELTQRLISMEGKVDSGRLRNGQLYAEDWPKITAAVARIADSPLYIDDNPKMGVNEIRSKARHIIQQNKGQQLGAIIIDYLQLMTGTGNGRQENRQTEIAEISRSLKIMARELQTPVIALSQLSRNLETRADKRPMLSDLRECVDGESVVTLESGERCKVKDVKPGMVVASVKNQRSVWAVVSDVWATGLKPVVTVTLQSGRQIVCTKDHRLFTEDETFKKVSELAIGSYVGVPFRLAYSDQSTRSGFPSDLARMLGYMAGNGTSLKHRGVGLIVSDADIRDDVKRIFADHFPAVTIREKPGPGTSPKWWDLTFSRLYANGYGKPYGNEFRNWLQEVGSFGSKDQHKYVPEAMFAAGQEAITNFLFGYLATDGCVKQRQDKETLNVHYDSTSEQLLRDVQTLLLYVGVHATINRGSMNTKSTIPIFRLNVSQTATNMQLMASLMKGFPGRKAAKLATHGAPDTKFDGCFSLPLSVSTRCAAYGRRDQRKRMNRLSALKFGKANKDSFILRFAESDLSWDRVVSIEDSGSRETYDLTVPESAAFVCDGILTHNSGSLEQDADVVMFLYRDEVYFPDSPDRGSAEIIVAKHRAGPVGKTRLAFLDHYTKFSNMART